MGPYCSMRYLWLYVSHFSPFSRGEAAKLDPQCIEQSQSGYCSIRGSISLHQFIAASVVPFFPFSRFLGEGEQRFLRRCATDSLLCDCAGNGL